jgi:hypothetical protein
MWSDERSIRRGGKLSVLRRFGGAVSSAIDRRRSQRKTRKPFITHFYRQLIVLAVLITHPSWLPIRGPNSAAVCTYPCLRTRDWRFQQKYLSPVASWVGTRPSFVFVRHEFFPTFTRKYSQTRRRKSVPKGTNLAAAISQEIQKANSRTGTRRGDRCFEYMREEVAPVSEGVALAFTHGLQEKDTFAVLAKLSSLRRSGAIATTLSLAEEKSFVPLGGRRTDALQTRFRTAADSSFAFPLVCHQEICLEPTVDRKRKAAG